MGFFPFASFKKITKFKLWNLYEIFVNYLHGTVYLICITMKGLPISRRKAIATLGLGTASLSLPLTLNAREKSERSAFRFCLNTSTISGQKPDLQKQVEIASKAGYDGIEVWVRDVQAALAAGSTTSSLKSFIDDHGIRVESAIGFAPWMTGGEAGFDPDGRGNEHACRDWMPSHCCSSGRGSG